MPAYFLKSVSDFLHCSPAEVAGALQQSYAADGFVSQYTRQTKAWSVLVPNLQSQLARLVGVREEAGHWSVILEYPLYRLRRRIDLVILAGDVIIVVECKVGAETFSSLDCRQVEEYALDLRDFHAMSYRKRIIPVLWSTHAHNRDSALQYVDEGATVASVVQVGTEGLLSYLKRLQFSKSLVHCAFSSLLKF